MVLPVGIRSLHALPRGKPLCISSSQSAEQFGYEMSILGSPLASSCHPGLRRSMKQHRTFSSSHSRASLVCSSVNANYVRRSQMWLGLSPASPSSSSPYLWCWSFAGRDRPVVRTLRHGFPLASWIGGSVASDMLVCSRKCGDFRSLSAVVTAAGHTATTCRPCLEKQQRRRSGTGVWSHRSSVFAAGGRRMRYRGNCGGLERTGRQIPSRSRAGKGDGSELPLADIEMEKFKEVTIEPTNRLLTLPTILTLARVAAVPTIVAVFYFNESWATAAGVAIFVLAALTDWLDGYLARKMGSSSAFGAFLDPVADKLIVAAALVLLCTKPLAVKDLATIPWLLSVPTIAIIGREITMSAVREWAAAEGGNLHKAVAVNKLGKIKTSSQMVAITLLLASGEGGLDSSLAGFLGVALLYVASILALWSLGIYIKGIWGSLSN